MQSMKIRKGDTVHVLSGKDRGKQGRVIEARPKERRVLVENLNMIKRHTRPRRMGQQAIQPGGVIEKAAPIPISNVMLVCPVCNRPTRVAVELREGKGEERKRVRVCKRADCGEAIEELTTIAGQRAQVRRARKSIASFKIRDGMPIGARVTLRGDRMWEFLDRLISIALPRIRDFRGLSPRSFDGRGNFSIGIREQIIFPEIDYDSIGAVRGLDVAITTSAQTDEEGLALLRGLGMPFAMEGAETSG